jgi:putative oxidoreductase
MIDQRLAPYGAAMLRISLGAMWISHALLKYLVFTIPGFAGFLSAQGMPSFLAWPVFLAELAGGILIVLGVHGRAVSAVLLPVLAGALSVHAGNGWVFTSANGGWEYPAFLIAASVVHILVGDGALALASGRLSAAGRLQAA